MKYLQKAPFSIAVSSGRRTLRERVWDEQNGRFNRKRASQPHEYVHGGAMCLVCGMDRRVPLHTGEGHE